MPRLSVVVSAVDGPPTSAQLRECITSVLDQELLDIEVLVVAAGDANEASDPRVKHLAYDGDGDPRNAAVAIATGDYLAFLDAKDRVAPGAYDVLVSSLQRSGSDLATGAVQHLTVAGMAASGSEQPAIFATPRTATNLTEQPALLDNQTSGNTLWRHAFWIARRLRWPDHAAHHDLLVPVRSYLLAAAIDVVTEVVLVHPLRPGEERSRRPRAQDMVAMAEHLEAALIISRELGEDRPAALKRRWDLSIVTGPLRITLSNLTEADDTSQRRIIETAGAFLVGAGPDIELSMRAIHRLKYHLARRRLLPQLLTVVKAERTGSLQHARAVRRGLHYYGDYPFRTDRQLRVPRAAYRLDKELNLRARVDDVWWEGETLHIEGFAHIGLLDVAAPGSGRLWLSLVPKGAGAATIRLPVERVRRPDVTAASKDAANTYDWAGFRTSVRASELRAKDGWVAATWWLRATVLRGGVRRRGPVTATSRGRARRPPLLDVGDGARIAPMTGVGDFAVVVSLPQSVVDSVTIEDDVLLLVGRRRGGDGFQTRIPLTDANEPLDLHAAADLVRVVADMGDGTEVVASRRPSGRLSVLRRPVAPEVVGISWLEGTPLVLTIRAPATDELTLVLSLSGAAREQGVTVERTDSGVVASVRPEAVPTLAGDLPLPQGTWDVLVRTADSHISTPLEVADSLAWDLPVQRTFGAKTFTVQEMQGRLQIESGVDLRDEERGAGHQRRLQRIEFPAFLARGLRDEVLFESYQSRVYADNARAVYEELASRDTGLACRWVVLDGQTLLPDGLAPVRRNSAEHYEALARSRYVVVPNYRPLNAWLTTPADQVVVQTWHGAPFKRIGLDNERGERASSPDYLEALRRESARWNFLLSPSPAATPILRGAFGFTGEMLETGYPRCDMFFRPDRDAVASRVRERLGLPAGKKVVLYAPTMRDDERYGGNRFTLDLRLDLDKARAELGDDHVLLVRRHAKVVDTVTSADGEFSRDVSLWPDVNELLLATDVLVTDYSSLMFDFANTGRPMLFFTYDLANYRDRLRGFYFDVERVPGPLLMTSDEVINGIRDADALRQQYDLAYRTFVTDFCPWDDGGASARFVDRVFLERAVAEPRGR
jgi:CDP-glycerol glycerophosphotransferase